MPCQRGMRGCSATCAHRESVYDYRRERERQEIEAEEDYRERDGNEQAPKLINYKTWLKYRRRK